MKKLFIYPMYAILIFTACGCRNVEQPKLIFNETFEENSSLFLNKNYFSLTDTTFDQGGEIISIARHSFIFKNNKFNSINDGNDSALKKEIDNPTIKNLAQYYCVSDSLSSFPQDKTETKKNAYETKQTEKFIFYLLKDSVGLPYLEIINKIKNKSYEIKVHDYADYQPELFLYDFDDDGVPEILLFSKFYLQRHNLIEVNIYRLK